MHSLLSLHIQHRLRLAGQARADGASAPHNRSGTQADRVSTVQGAPRSYYVSPRVGQITSPHSSVARTNHVVPAHCRAAGKCWSAHSLCPRGSSGGTKMELFSLIRRKTQDAHNAHSVLSSVLKRKGERGQKIS